MRRRPQPNPRRGLLRAAAVVIVLVILLAGGILLVSSLTAPTTNAPTVPPTPGPATSRPATPTVIVATPVKTATPKKKKDIALGQGRGGLILERSWSHPIRMARQGSPWSQVATAASDPSGRYYAFYRPGKDAYAPASLLVLDRNTGQIRTAGHGDALVRPVWRNGSELAYVGVQRARAYPGARWTLIDVKLLTGRSVVVYSVPAVNMQPLGWSRGRLLFDIGEATSTVLFAYDGTGVTPVNELMSQIITSARLSPDGRYIAFLAPTNCSECTLDVFDTATYNTWYGPTGAPSEADLAWSTDGHFVVTGGQGTVEAVTAGSWARQAFQQPAGLAAQWQHPMIARLQPGNIALQDDMTGTVYSSHAKASS